MVRVLFVFICFILFIFYFLSDMLPVNSLYRWPLMTFLTRSVCSESVNELMMHYL